MIEVTVERAPADKAGPEISDPLITSIEAAIARGTAEIDRQCTNRVVVAGTMPLAVDIAPGQIAQVGDAEHGTYRGMVKRVAINLSKQGKDLTATASLQIEREE